jgi:hypothetical protein
MERSESLNVLDYAMKSFGGSGHEFRFQLSPVPYIFKTYLPMGQTNPLFLKKANNELAY